MKIYTIWNNGIVTRGATVTLCNDKMNGKYPGISIIEDGNLKKRTSIKVDLFSKCQKQKWIENFHILNICTAKIEKNGYDQYELHPSVDRYNDSEKWIICVFRTHNGFCGSSIHTGDVIDVKMNKYKDFPGIIICGKIAKEPTIENGVGKQLIALMPPDCIFHIGCFRKVFIDYPSSYYYGLDSYFYKCDSKLTELLGGFSLRERDLLTAN